MALKQGKAGKTVLQNGQAIPTVIIEKSLYHHRPKVAPDFSLPCSGVIRRWSPERLVASLEQAGDQRFAERVARYQSDWSRIENDQSLYQGLLESLGYSQNKLPFLELARRLPLRQLDPIIRAEAPEEVCLNRLQAFFLGQAGFLPSQRPGFILESQDEYTGRLEKAWSALPRGEVMDYHNWELFKVRPGNHPVRRLIALSLLLYRYRQESLLQAFLGLVRNISPVCSPISLEMAFVTSAQGYWANHYDFDSPPTAAGPVLLGRNRAAEILINVIFPFAFSWSRMAHEVSLGVKALDLYSRYPRLEANSIERHMLQQLDFNRGWINTARRQQGLLHIYKTLCTQGKCEECELRF